MTSTYLRSVFLVCAAVFFLCASEIPGDTTYPQNYFSLPVNRSIQLSGTFGELRSNHFHAGLDIKSKDGTVGETLHAAAPGFISRISVQSGGYGNVIYMDHPNGYSTVYAHMDHFTEEVSKYVKTMQYAHERFAVDLYPRPNQFAFKQGDVIGYLGNSGSSTGPHVHFEIRKTADQLPINPLLFGLKVSDDDYPGMRTLKVYYLDKEINDWGSKEYNLQNLGPGKYQLADTLVESAWRVGFGLKVYDRMAGASNQNGIYGLRMTVDGIPQYGFELTSIPFSLTRYLNAHIDYAERRFNGGFYHRCYKLPGNALSIYQEEHEKGIVELYAQQPRRVEITAYDAAGNTSSLTFYIKRNVDIPAVEQPSYQYAIDYLESESVNREDLVVSFEPHTFYNNIKLQIDKSELIMKRYYSNAFTLRPSDIPVHRYFDLTIKSTGIPEHLQSKAFIARVSDNGSPINCGGVAQGDQVYSRVRAFGTYSVAVDTIAPEIIPITFRSNMRGMSRMSFRIDDSQAVEGQANGLAFEARVDGKWILMEYEGKRAMLTHWFDDHISDGDHELVLKVWDDRGNVNTLKRTFSR